MKLSKPSGSKKLATVMAVLLLLIAGTAAVYAAAAEPGSKDDPVVTKSYVDEAIKEAVGAVEGSGNDDSLATKDYVDEAIAEAVDGALASGGGSGSGSGGASYKVVELAAGEKLLGSEGTEIILRSGLATAIDNGANGVSDMTAGKDLMTGDNVGQNHLLLVPRNDGRGIKVSTEAFAMVRGDYVIE